MIAAVPSDLIAGLTAQTQNASGDAAAGGFNLLLNVLMALDTDTAASCETPAAGNDPIELAAGPAGDDTLGQSQAETNTAADPNGAVQASVNAVETQLWMQMPVQMAAPTETVPTRAAKTDSADSVTVPDVPFETVPAQVQSQAQAEAQSLMAVVQPEAAPETKDTGTKKATPRTSIQQIFMAPAMAASSAPVQSVTKKPAEQAQQGIDSAAATVINIAQASVAPTRTQAQTQEQTQAQAVAPATAEVVSIKPAPAATKKNQPENETAPAEPALVAEIAAATVQPTVTIAATTAVKPEPAGAAATKPVQATGSSSVAPTAPQAAATADPAATATTTTTASEPVTPFKWNLSELIHRFDERLNQAMGNQAKPVEHAAAQPLAVNPAATETTASETPVLKTTTVAPETQNAKDTETVAAAPQQAALAWEAAPKTEITADNRTTALIDQVRQASEWLAEKAEGVIRAGDHGVEANMKLYPPDMGGVRVSLNVSNDLNVQAQFIADRPETAQLIKQNVDLLQQSLARQGLSLDKVQVIAAPAAAQQSGTAGEQTHQPARREPDTMTQQQNRQFENRNSQQRRQREQA